jgi:hypothetical protein
MGLACGLCGLRANSRERGRSEEWPGESGMWPGTASSGGWRSPQAFAGTRMSTRKPARSGKKKPQRERWGFNIAGGGGNLPVFALASANPLRQRRACSPKPCLRPASRGFDFMVGSKNEKPPDTTGWFFIFGGGGGNRTRVQKHSTDSSTYLAVSFDLTLPTRTCTLRQDESPIV